MKTGRIKLKKVNIAVFFLFILILGCNTNKKGEATNSTKANELSKDEISDGWMLLFDGKTLKGWRGIGKNIVPETRWKVENGTIRNIGSGEVKSLADGQPADGGDIITVKKFDNFELYFEWKILVGGNTGIKYNVSEEMSMMVEPKYSALGLEFQLLDDEAPDYKGAIDSAHMCGSLYDMIPARNKHLNPPGEYNSGRLLVNGNHIEHWLNGEKVIEYELNSRQLDSLYQKSKYMDYPEFLTKRTGHIVVQNHKDDAWFRNIKIREL